MTKIDVKITDGVATLTNDQNTSLRITDFDPSELLAGALAKCTASTVRNFARKNELLLTDLSVQVDYDRDRDTKTAYFKVYLNVEGDLSDKELQKLFKVAEKSYIRRVLSQDIQLKGYMHYQGQEIISSN